MGLEASPSSQSTPLEGLEVQASRSGSSPEGRAEAIPPGPKARASGGQGAPTPCPPAA